MNFSNCKVAIVHDWLTNMGGAEKVVEALVDIFPKAPIYTSMAIRENLSDKLKNADIRTSFLQKKVKGIRVNHQKYLPWMPMAFESFDLNEYDLVISSSSSCAKGVITNPATVHVCYCYTPTRYVWEQYYAYTKGMKWLKSSILKYFMNYLRLWDFSAAQRVDRFIAISKTVQQRIAKHYRRESEVIYPPVDTEFYTLDNTVKREDFYLCVSRLVRYKRIDIAVEAFNELGLPLIVIGAGEELERLKAVAKPNVKFLGRQSDEVVRDHMRRCKAFVFPGEEDFGITPVEAQACGAPVIAYGRGGALETVVDEVTGKLFENQNAKALISSIAFMPTQAIQYSQEKCRENALCFNTSRFYESIQRVASEMKCGIYNV